MRLLSTSEGEKERNWERKKETGREKIRMREKGGKEIFVENILPHLHD